MSTNTLTDTELHAQQQASGHFVDAECVKCGAEFYVNTQYPQLKCVVLVDHHFCTGDIKHVG